MRDRLLAYGLIHVGEIDLPDEQTFAIRLVQQEAGDWQKAIYAFLVGNQIMRIGSSKGRLRSRFNAWNRDVSNRLRGRESSTPEWEAAEWRERLQEHGGGEVFARTATLVTTPVGTFPAYMDEESVLINRYHPPLNRHTNR
jgi:hypothetical protein